tara:strand:- start:44 stop:220 length:177 start_codon:yes stop_codon:yes gene_type:complete
MSNIFDALLTAECDGAPFPGVQCQFFYAFAEQSDFITAVVDDDRIYNIVEALLGPGFI